MGEEQGYVFEPQFNRSVKVQSTDHRITSNAGVIVLREAEHRLGLFKAIEKDVLASGGRRVKHATVDIDSFPIVDYRLDAGYTIPRVMDD